MRFIHTVDSLLADFDKLVTRLEDAAGRHANAADVAQSVADSNRAQAQRAQAAANNFRKIVSV